MKRIILLFILLFNLLPCLYKGELTIGSMQVVAQEYGTELSEKECAERGGTFDVCGNCIMYTEEACDYENGSGGGLCGGPLSYTDECGTCVGGSTGLTECVQDCSGEWGGTAYPDQCSVCVGGNTGLSECIQDCSGEYGGTARTDDCGMCVEGNTGFTACIPDCNGQYGGTATTDQCGICVGGTTGLTDCTPDCNNDIGGTAYHDDCGSCVSGNTGLVACLPPDCNNERGGTAYIDVCGQCVGGNTGLTACAPDCNGVTNGVAYYDDCNICVGGNTGRSPCCIANVQLNEDNSKKYGFDNFNINATVPWKSILALGSDILNITISPSDKYNTVFFKSIVPTKLTVSPVNAPAASFDLNLNAAALSGTDKKAEAQVLVNCGGVDGNNISKVNIVSYAQVTKRVAITLVHSKAHIGYAGYKSSDVSDQLIIDFLNAKCYNQGIVKWEIKRNPEKYVDFDANNDYKLDNNTGSVTAEMNTVYANCYDNSVGVDANVFLINNGTGTNAGLTARTLKSSWIMMNSTSNPSNTIAHELGHSCFSFVDITTDLDNIMNSYLIPNSPAKLRKNQWDMMHP